MLNNPFLKIISVPRVIGAVGTAQYINPKTHSPAPPPFDKRSTELTPKAQGERSINKISDYKGDRHILIHQFHVFERSGEPDEGLNLIRVPFHPGAKRRR